LLSAALGSEQLAERLGGKLARKTDGNPFFLFEMLRECKRLEPGSDGGWLTSGELAAIDVPSSVRELLRARLAGLDDRDRSLLEAGAAHGFAFDPDLVARVLE